MDFRVHYSVKNAEPPWKMQAVILTVGIRLHTVVRAAAGHVRPSPRCLCGPEVTAGQQEKLPVEEGSTGIEPANPRSTG